MFEPFAFSVDFSNSMSVREHNHQSAISHTDHKKQKGGISSGHEHPKAKEARKERKVLEKKMALNRKRKLGSK